METLLLQLMLVRDDDGALTGVHPCACPTDRRAAREVQYQCAELGGQTPSKVVRKIAANLQYLGDLGCLGGSHSH